MEACQLVKDVHLLWNLTQLLQGTILPCNGGYLQLMHQFHIRKQKENKTWEAGGRTTLVGRERITHACWGGCLSRDGLTGELAYPGTCKEAKYFILAAFTGNAGCGTKTNTLTHGKPTSSLKKIFQTLTMTNLTLGRFTRQVMYRTNIFKNNFFKGAWLL